MTDGAAQRGVEELMTMASGGARNRSGPQADSSSLRTAKRGLIVTLLPGEGYRGKPPAFPLLTFQVRRWEYEGQRRFQVADFEATEAFREREAELWAEVWTFPQAAAWARESWRWQAVAMWVRTAVVCESSEATAADKGAIHRFADQVGLTPAGLKENGWQIAADETAVKRTARTKPKAASARDRLKVVDGGGG